MQGLTVLDHTEPRWALRYTRTHRENGAATYSKDIIQHQIPVWREYLKDDTVISTCPPLFEWDKRVALAVQYLHTYDYKDPTGPAMRIYLSVKKYADRVLFVTAYKALEKQLQDQGLNAIYVPMTIDTKKVYSRITEKEHGPGVAVYFGNIIKGKVPFFADFKERVRDLGWTVHHIAGSQPYCWEQVSCFEYGIGVGRCALEMMALGTKTMIAGQQFGGLVTCQADIEAQTLCNFNGRVTTYDRDLAACVAGWPNALTGPVNDSSLSVETLEKVLPGLL